MRAENSHNGPTLPYPTLSKENVACEVQLARPVMSSYYCELAAISGYIYRSIVTEPGSPTLSDVFSKIAMDEMHHFRLLGELIRLIGGNPVIRTNLAVRPINTAEICRSTPEGIHRLITESIREEESALAEYKRLAGRSSGTPAELFLRIAIDEERHIQTLKGFL